MYYLYLIHGKISLIIHSSLIFNYHVPKNGLLIHRILLVLSFLINDVMLRHFLMVVAAVPLPNRILLSFHVRWRDLVRDIGAGGGGSGGSATKVDASSPKERNTQHLLSLEDSKANLFWDMVIDGLHEIGFCIEHIGIVSFALKGFSHFVHGEILVVSRPENIN